MNNDATHIYDKECFFIGALLGFLKGIYLKNLLERNTNKIAFKTLQMKCENVD